MSLTVIVGFSQQLHDLYELNLSTYVGTEVICKHDFDEVASLLDVLPRTDLIVCSSTGEENSLAHQLDFYLTKKNKHIPLILVGAEIKLERSYVHVPASKEVKPVIKNAAKILGIDSEMMVKQIVPEYFPLPIGNFVGMGSTDYTIYLREDNNSYLPLFHAGGNVVDAKLNQLMSNGIDQLYVQKQERLKVVSSVTQKMVETLTDKDLPIDERMKSTDAAMAIVRDKIGIEVDGMSEETVEMADAAIDSLSTVVESEPRLSSLLENLSKNPSSFAYKHCQLLTFLGYHAIENMSWGTDEQKKKIAFVAFFHDITLVRDDLVKIESAKELEEQKLSKADENRVINHAVNAAKLVTEFPRAPIGAETIIKQHHGARDGKGFPRHFGENISPLAIIFIVCEAFTHQLLKNEEQTMDCEEIIQKIHYRFTSEKYANVVHALSKLQF